MDHTTDLQSTTHEQMNSSSFACEFCSRILTSKSGRTLHQKKCKMKPPNPTVSNRVPVAEEIAKDKTDQTANEQKLLYMWGKYSNATIENTINSIYEQIVFWRKNLFLLPTGSAGKDYIDEVTRLLNSWSQNAPSKDTDMKAIMIMPSLLLQKPKKDSKSVEHRKALERRLLLWHAGDLWELFEEASALQTRLPDNYTRKRVNEISKQFADRMKKGNINGALKLLSNNMQNGVLPLNDETLKILKQKHPSAKPARPELLLPDPPKQVHPVIFESITADTIRTAATRTKGGSGPSNMDSDGWKRMLLSKSFGESSTDLCKAIASVARKMCTVEVNDTSLEALLAARLIPLDKNPGLRPIGVGEVLRRIIGKAVVTLLRDDITKSVGSLQVCAGHEGGCESAIHAMKDIFDQQDTEAVLMIDASNAFNSVNRNVFLHNVRIVCPEIATFVTNCYALPSRLFIIGGKEILSAEGTTQGDPVAMPIYAIAIIPLILMIIEVTDNLPGSKTKTEAYADDLSAAGNLKNMKIWWQKLCEIGPLFGYYPEPTKCWLIVKPVHEQKAKDTFSDTKINITTDGKRHLGAALGSKSYKYRYVSDKIDEWCKQLKLLSKIALTEPHAAYACFVTGFRHKLTYTMRTITGISHLFKKLDDILTTEFIPSLSGGLTPNEAERKLISIPAKFGGLGIPIFQEMSDIEYANSREMRKNLADRIVNQERTYLRDQNILKKKANIKRSKTEMAKSVLSQIDAELTDKQKKLLSLNQESGSSMWLTTIPLKSEGYYLNKSAFRDLICLRYGWELSRLPATCECGATFTIDHALSCKKGGFVSIRHNELRNLTARLLRNVCHDVKIEPSLEELSGEVMSASTNVSNEARLDISAIGFWETHQKAFF